LTQGLVSWQLAVVELHRMPKGVNLWALVLGFNRLQVAVAAGTIRLHTCLLLLLMLLVQAEAMNSP